MISILSILLLFFFYHGVFILRGKGERLESEGPGEREDQRWEHNYMLCVTPTVGLNMRYDLTVDCALLFRVKRETQDRWGSLDGQDSL